MPKKPKNLVKKKSELWQKKLIQRKHSIDELYTTEQDFCKEMTDVYDAFLDNNERPSEFGSISIFEELKLVIAFSSDLISGLEKELSLDKDEHIQIGICLTRKSEEMKIIYAKYLQSYSNFITAMKKYENTPRVSLYMSNHLQTLHSLHNSKVFTLNSLLIKPVQRVFKYPLFIKRILENTEPSHIDYPNLELALDSFKDMLEFINEYKRRKDLISKYLSANTNDPTSSSITEIVKKMSLRNLKKKTTRITVQFSNIFGLYHQQVIDQVFYREEANFRLVEKLILTFFNNLNEISNNLKNQMVAEENYLNSLLNLFSDHNYDFMRKLTESRIEQNRAYTQNLKLKILMNLETLFNYLISPHKLIEKRKHKLIDFEAGISKEMLNDLETSRKDYEALNSQLIEELPMLTNKIIRLFINALLCFCQLTKEFLKNISMNFRINTKTNDDHNRDILQLS